MLIASSLDNELLQFIQTKKLDSLDVSLKEVYTLYSKMIIDILYYVNRSFNNIEYSIACCELAHSIFIITLNHTYNTKLTMFLCDRAKTLFIEYISISNEMSSMKKINLVDIKIYIYSKTIGPLHLSNKKISVDTNSVHNASYNLLKMNDLLISYKQFIYSAYTYLVNHIDDSNSALEEDMEYMDMNTAAGSHKEDVSSKYKNDSICTSLELIRSSLELKLFIASKVLNQLYIDELLNINFELYKTIFVPINKLIIQLQLIIDSKIKFKISSKSLYTTIQSLSDKDYETYNSTFLNKKKLKHTHIYTNTMIYLKTL